MQIDVPTAKEMTALYETRRLLINGQYGINDTKAIFFTIDQVKSFMTALPADVTGVRIYLGAYPPDDITYPNQTTIIAIGTVADGNGKNVDNMQLAAAPLDGTGGGAPANHGGLCPPNDDCT